MLPGSGDFARRVVVEAGVGSVVVAIDVGGDRGARLVERLELLAPNAAQLELGEPGLDERLALGVAVTAAAVRDLLVLQAGSEAAGGVGAAVVGPERELSWSDAAFERGAVDDRARFGRAAADIQGPAGDLAGAAVDRGVEVGPAVLGDPDAGHVEVPELVGAGDLEIAGPAPSSFAADRLQ